MEGEVEAYFYNEVNNGKVSMIMKPVIFFGDYVLTDISGGIEVKCLTSVKVAAIHKSLNLGSQFYEIKLLKTLLRASSYFLNTFLISRLGELTFESVEERLVNVFRNLSEISGYEDTQCIQVNLPITHQLIANLIGCSRARVTNVLSDLIKQNKLIFEKEKTIYYKDLNSH